MVPQTDVLRSRTEGETYEEIGVAAVPVVVEIRRSSAHPDELHVDVQPVADPNDIAEQAAVLVDSVRLRLPVEADERACRKKVLRDC